MSTRIEGRPPSVILASQTVKVQALEAGAGDYVTKPFRLRELIARMRSGLRRIRARLLLHAPVLRVGQLELETEHRLLRKTGREIHLSPKEFELLAFLIQHKDIPITHARLSRAVWGHEYGSEPGYLSRDQFRQFVLPPGWAQDDTAVAVKSQRQPVSFVEARRFGDRLRNPDRQAVPPFGNRGFISHMYLLKIRPPSNQAWAQLLRLAALRPTLPAQG